MPKTKISEYSATANSNTDVGGINIDEGCAPSGINDAIRTMMAQLKNFQTGTGGDSFNGPVNGTVGATTPATAAVTTLTTSSTVTHNGGTANGVAYLNGSKVLTTGSALVFDGTNLGLGVTPSAWYTSSGYKSLELGRTGNGISSLNASDVQIRSNSYLNSSGTSTYANNGYAALYEQYNSAHTWSIAASGTAGNAITFTTAMTLDASGQLGLGTTSPSDTIGYGRTLDIQGGLGAAVYLRDADAPTTQYAVIAYDGNDNGLKISNQNSSGYMRFSTAGAERARIDSSGNLLVGTTSKVYEGKISVSFNGNGGAGSQGIAFIDTNASLSGDYALFVNSSGNVAGRITHNGTTTVAYTTASDYRLKNITGPITSSGAYIDSLIPVEGTWKADGSTFVGLIAHEAQEVSRTPISTGKKDGLEMQGMDYSSPEIIANLIAEIQSLRQRVAQLESN